MNRSDFQRLSRTRVKEAQLLFDHGYYDGAFYLAGYAVEFALKACYCRGVRRFDWPPETKEYGKLYSHNLKDLATVSGVRAVLEQSCPDWGLVVKWTEGSRYQNKVKRDAEELLSAVTDRKAGVLACLRKPW